MVSQKPQNQRKFSPSKYLGEMLVKALIIVRLFCLVALLWKVKVWQFDLDRMILALKT